MKDTKQNGVSLAMTKQPVWLLCFLLLVGATGFHHVAFSRLRFTTSTHQSSSNVVVVDLSTPVFIELTDAFGMMYNGNVPVLIERALTKDHDGGRMISIKTLKYTNPARLGDQVSVNVQPSKKKGKGSYSAKLTATNNRENGPPVTISSGTSITVSNGESNDNDEKSTTIVTTSWNGKEKLFVSCFKLWPDEMGDLSSTRMALPTRTLFNVLERGRSNMLGGPEVLAQSAQSAVHYYVARVTDYQLSFIDTSLLTSRKGNKPWVRVSTTVTPVGSQMLDFDQQVSLALDDTITADTVPCDGSTSYCYTVAPNNTGDCKLFNDVLLARCCVTVACVDAVSGVPAILPTEIQTLLL